MKQPAKINGRLVITPPVNPHWSTADYAHETAFLRSTVWPAVQRLLAEEWPGVSAVFTADEVTICTHCRSEFEELSADEVANDSTKQDEHSVEGEPVCCYAAIAEFRAERGIPALPPRGGAA
ncbi:hypothetical protein ACFRLW_12870 [Streptomyces sp. NPDC056728]